MVNEYMICATDIVSILEKEMDNRNDIHLYLDGNLWIAYERSAYNLASLHVPMRMEREVIREGIDVILLKAAFRLDDLRASLKPSVELKLLSDDNLQFIMCPESREDFSTWRAAQLKQLPA